MLTCLSLVCEKADPPTALFSRKEGDGGGGAKVACRLILTPFKELSQKPHTDFHLHLFHQNCVNGIISASRRPGKIVFS